MTADDPRSALLDALAPVLEVVGALSLADPAAAEAELERRLPLGGPTVESVRQGVLAGLSAGWLTPRGEPGMRFGRLLKPGTHPTGLSVDAVQMDRPGPGHLHPQGEVDLCFALTGAARFDGRPEGWVVKAPGSWHVPTVSSGEMAILYFLPSGAIDFTASPPDSL